MFRKSLLLSCFLLTSSAAVAMDSVEDTVVASARPKATWSLNLVLVEKSETYLKNLYQKGNQSRRPKTDGSLKAAEGACASEPDIDSIERGGSIPIFKINLPENATEDQENLLNQLAKAEIEKLKQGNSERLQLKEIKFTDNENIVNGCFSKKNDKKVKKMRASACAFFKEKQSSFADVVHEELTEVYMTVRLSTGSISIENLKQRLAKISNGKGIPLGFKLSYGFEEPLRTIKGLGTTPEEAP